MFTYFTHRVLVMILTLLVISIVTFIIIQLPPGDYLSNQMAELIAQGDRAEHAGINFVGLRRAGGTRQDIQAVRVGFRALFFGEGTRKEMLEDVEKTLAPKFNVIQELCAFMRNSERGVSAARDNSTEGDGA